ncbi:response regulator [Fulvivirgaceae bacterium PWU4]|uniref:Response regulator n=1 Tax=Chryseosolibacter histidini TaxID=2782349 RepID=A0AAP2DLM7_9BACT|nr:response regulator [Chryseosolibacter histidini]MBT1697558.1 response regulator [Chryseosolibacter histidini]
MKKIVFADDDSTIQDVINLILEDEYKVTIFSKGEPLLNNEFELPDLFLLDKQLSGIDGLEVCRFLKTQESTRHIPVIMISATPNISSLAKAAGADGVIEKPFPIQQLRQLIATYI